MLARDLHGVAHVVEREVVEQDAIDLRIERLRSSSRFSTSTSSSTFAFERARLAHGRGDRAGRGDVILLDQDRVEQTDAMIRAAAAAHRVFLREPQAGIVLRVSRMRHCVPATAST